MNATNSPKSSWLNYFFYCILLLKTLEAVGIMSHGDALYYHLVGPKIWSESSWSVMWEELTAFALAGYFDLLYFIPFFISDSLMINQIVGQLMHFAFSIGLGSILCLRWINHRLWGPLAAIALLTISQDSGIFHYAKNDGAAALAALVAAWLIYKRDYQIKKLVLLGLLFGIIPGIKLNGIMAVIPMSLYFAWDHRRRPKEVAMVAGLAFAALLPALLKNYLYTGNPLFPALISIFPAQFTEPMLATYDGYFGNQASWQQTLLLFKNYFTGKYLLALHPALMIANHYKGNHRINLFAYFSLATFLIYLAYNGSMQSPRFFFATYFMQVLFFFMSLKALVKLKDKQQNILLTALIVLIMVDSKIDLTINNVREMLQDYSTLNTDEIIAKRIPLSQLWQPIAPAGGRAERIVSDFHSSSYYLPPGVRLHTVAQSYGAAFLYRCHEPGDLRQLNNYKYSLLKHDKNNPCYRKIREQGTLIKEHGDLNLYLNPQISP